MTRDPSTLRVTEGSPETPSITKEIAEHILTNPDFIFSEYQKLLTILRSKPSVTPREVSIIYRRELGDVKNPEFVFNSMAINWLILNTEETINSPVEMVNLVEALSGIQSKDLPERTSGEVERQAAGTAQKVQQELLDKDDNDISAWLAENAGRE